MGKLKYPLVYLEWCDAISNDKNWVSVNEAIEWGDNEDWLIRQTSFLIKETKEYLLLASKVNPQDDGFMVGGLLKIPTTWIKKRINLSKAIK